MAYPSKEEIQRVMAEIEIKLKNGQIKTLKVLGKDASLNDHLKFKITQKLAQFKSDLKAILKSLT